MRQYCESCGVELKGAESMVDQYRDGRHCNECLNIEIDKPRKKVRNPIIVNKYFRTSREDRTVNQRYDATCTITWNVELGPKRRPWFHLYLNEFQMVFTSRLRYRGHTIWEKIQMQAWESKFRKWIFNEWLFNQFEDWYQNYENSLPEDPYRSFSMYE